MRAFEAPGYLTMMEAISTGPAIYEKLPHVVTGPIDVARAEIVVLKQMVKEQVEPWCFSDTLNRP